MREVDKETHNGLVRLIESYHRHIPGGTKMLMKKRLKDILHRLRADEYAILTYWQRLELTDSRYFELQRQGLLYKNKI